MTELDISELEAQQLIEMDKVSTSPERLALPDLGGKVIMPFRSPDGREEFCISLSRSSFSLEKRNYHLRGRKIIGLARLDLDGPGHRNPDGEEIGPRHLHVYRQGYGLKFAVEIPKALFRNLDNMLVTLEDFFRYCHVISPPEIKASLFTQ